MSEASLPGPAPGAAPAAPWGWWTIAAWAAVFLLVAGVLQFVLVPVPVDADSAYHFVVGRLIRQHGLLHAFPWTPFSWLADHYADKELLFHLLFVPVAGLPWAAAAHAVGTAAGALALLSLYLVLRAEGVRLAGLWAMAPLLASPAFVFRFSLVRPHLLSIALALAVLWAAVRGRLLLLVVVSALYPWSYVGWPLVLALVAAAEGVRALSGARLRIRPLAAALAGLGLGLLLHPNSRELLRFTWIQLVEVMVRGAWAGHAQLELGDEFRAFTPGEWASLLLAAAAMLLSALALAIRARRERPEALAFALAALGFGLLTVRTARFAEYFVPFAAAALALGARDLRRRWIGPAVLAACAAYSGVETTGLLRAMGQKREVLPAPSAARLERSIPPGAQVFTCEWGVTGILMAALPERRFLVALDPTFFQFRDPERYALWYRLPREAPPDLARTIRDRFGARYVVCLWDERFRKFFDRLAFEPGVRTVLLDDAWNAYELGEP